MAGTAAAAPAASPQNALMSFFWGPNGQKLTPQQAAANQEVANAMILRQGAPKNVGEGLSAIGQALIAKDLRDKGMAAQSEGLDKATADFAALQQDPNKAVDFLANDAFATPGQQSIAQAMFAQRMMATNPQMQAQIAQMVADTHKSNAEADMFERGGAASGPAVQMSDGTWAVPTQYGGFRTMNAPVAQNYPPADTSSAPAPDAPAAPIIQAPSAPPVAPTPAPVAAAPAQAGPPHPLSPAELEAQKALATKTGEIKGALPQQMVAAKTSLAQLDQSDALVSTFIDQAIKDANGLSTGWVGKLSEQVPGTPAYNLSKTLDTVRANIGFDKLAAMRAASPSGGALGQVSNFEEQLLQSVLGSLDQGQDPSRIIDNLNRLKGFLGSNKAQREAAFNADYGGVKPLSGDQSFNAATANANDAVGTPPDGYKVKDANGKLYIYQGGKPVPMGP